ncbi:hypothetical protein BH10PSE8_BH10PSE8_00720 [soil metagenome]
MKRGQSGPLSGGKHYWTQIRKITAAQGGLFTVNDVFGWTGGVTRPAITIYVRALLADGHVEVAEVRHWGGRCEKTYRLLRQATAAPQLTALHNQQAIRRQQIWRAMRALQSFTIRELACAASTEEAPVSDGVAQNYVWWLRRADYVALVGRAGTVGHYQLLRRMNTGPYAPIVRHREQSVVDRNNGQTVNLNGTQTKGWAA